MHNQTAELINVNCILPIVQFVHIINTFLYTSSIWTCYSDH